MPPSEKWVGLTGAVSALGATPAYFSVPHTLQIVLSDRFVWPHFRHDHIGLVSLSAFDWAVWGRVEDLAVERGTDAIGGVTVTGVDGVACADRRALTRLYTDTRITNNPNRTKKALQAFSSMLPMPYKLLAACAEAFWMPVYASPPYSSSRSVPPQKLNVPNRGRAAEMEPSMIPKMLRMIVFSFLLRIT